MTVQRRLTKASTLTVLIGLLALAGVAIAGFNLARAADGGSPIYACVTSSGYVRVVDEGARCRGNETPVSWNSEGAQGEQGPAGPAGSDGEVNVNLNADDGNDLRTPTIFVTATGESQGEIKGGSTSAGTEDNMEVFGFSHEVVSPRDAASGLPTGKRQHKPISIIKSIDKATPLLATVLYNNENLTEVEIKFYRTDRTGKSVNHYTITLQNASIASISSSDPLSPDAPPREEISFTYEKITQTWNDGGITAEDDWETPAV